MQVLVTGGGGFLGGRIVARLLRRGDQVRILVRRPCPQLAAQGAAEFLGDLRAPATLAAACRGCDLAIHTAAKAGVWGRSGEFWEVNVGGTQNLLDACVRENVPHLLFTSSPSVVFGRGPVAGADETSPYPARHLADYPASKAEAERRVLAANGRGLPGGGHLRTCALRPHLIWGAGDPHLVPRLVDLARRGRLRQVGDGTNRVDLTHVENAAAAHLQAAAALLRPGAAVAGQAYFIGDAEPVRLWDWLRDLLGRLGLRLPPRAVPFRVAYAAGAVEELLHRLLPALGEPCMTRFVASQLALDHWFRHDAARRDFGYRPVAEPAAELERLVAWLRAGMPGPGGPC